MGVNHRITRLEYPLDESVKSRSHWYTWFKSATNTCRFPPPGLLIYRLEQIHLWTFILIHFRNLFFPVISTKNMIFHIMLGVFFIISPVVSKRLRQQIKDDFKNRNTHMAVGRASCHRSVHFVYNAVQLATTYLWDEWCILFASGTPCLAFICIRVIH